MKYHYKKLIPLKLTPKQTERFKDYIEILKDMESKGQLGAIIAQIWPERDIPIIECVIIPDNKARRIYKIIRKEPSGKIRRRYIFKDNSKLESFFQKWIKEK